jgi:hypothetical protein
VNRKPLQRSHGASQPPAREDCERQEARAPAASDRDWARSDRDGARSDRDGLVVRPGLFLTAVIASALAAGFAIYWLLRSMHI